MLQGIYITVSPQLDQQLEQGDNALLLFFGSHPATYYLIARELGDGVYERVGVLTGLYSPFSWCVVLDAEYKILDQVTLPHRQDWYGNTMKEASLWLV